MVGWGAVRRGLVMNKTSPQRKEDMNELQIKTEQGKITTNLEPLKKQIAEVAEKYKGIKVQEDDVPAAKKDVAELRHMRTDIEDGRKAVKKEWNAPLDAFEKEVKEALKPLDDVIEEINGQIKAFEKAEKEAKKEECKKIYAEQISDEFKAYLPFEKVFDETWLNKSTSEKTIISDLNAKLTQVRADLEAIKALNSECESDCMRAYLDNNNSLSAAIKRNSDYLSAKSAAEEKARLEVERKMREEQAREEANKQAQEEVFGGIEEVPTREDDDLPFPVKEVIGQFDITGQTNIDKVMDFVKTNNIPCRFGYLEGE